MDDPGPTNSNPGFVIGAIIGLVCLLILSAYFSLTETAFTSLNKLRVENLSKKSRTYRVVLKLSSHYERVLSTILIGNNIVNIAASVLATVLFVQYLGDMGPTIATIVVTIVVLIFGEVTPKSLAKERPEFFAKLSAYPLCFFYVLFWPIGMLLTGIQMLVKKMFHIKKKAPVYTEEEFSMLVEDMNEAKVLNDIEEDIIQNTIEYGDTKVEEIMTPKEEVDYVWIKDDFDTICKKFVESNRTRMVVCKKKNINTAFGVIHGKDLFELVVKGDKDFKKIIMDEDDIVVVRPGKKISRTFKLLQSKHQHLAIVKEEKEVLGIVTMEDILEELVGEIRDENDED